MQELIALLKPQLAGSEIRKGTIRLCVALPKWEDLGVETQVHQASSDSEDAFLGGLSEHQPHGDDPWAVTVTLEGRPVILSIDTGAEVTVISEIW